MSAICLLRSQSHLINFTKRRLLSPQINSIISLNRYPQNPNFSRHLSNHRFIHSINHRSSSESPLLVANEQTEETTPKPPISESNSYQNPRKWSVFNSTSGEPKTSDNEEKSAKEVVNSAPNYSNTPAKQNIVWKGRKGKSKMQWVCSNCGHTDLQWWGSCRSCENPGTMVQFSTEEAAGGKLSGFEYSENAMRSWLPSRKAGRGGPVRLADVNRGVDQSGWRIRLYGILGAEVAQVLGGGVVPGSLVLVGGDPGVGKSTLLLQIAGLIAESVDIRGGGPVVYISGEESVEQIGNRADRLSITAEDLFLYSSTNIEDILEKVQPLLPRAVIIDSIQTVYLKGVTGSPGGVSQVKECTAALLRFSKETGIPVLLIGHVNKNGDIAGPQILEHIVDVVLYMEGEKNSSHRLLRSVKNRFGSTDELGVFEMSESGLQAVSNPSEMFLTKVHSQSKLLPGIAVAVIMDGSRTFLIEVQALYVEDSTGKHYNGVQASRADMIISVLKKQAGLKMQDYSVFLNVVSGLSLTETSGDLAVAAAICSSYLEYPIPNNVAFIGEVGLGGELRMVPRIEKRIANLAKLGYKMCIVPKMAEKALATPAFKGLRIVACNNLKEVIAEVFTK